jgi:hypothetical protein
MSTANEWFIVERSRPTSGWLGRLSGRLSGRLASHAEVEDFLDACGIKAGSLDWYAAFAGIPIDVDGRQVRFLKTEKSP